MATVQIQFKSDFELKLKRLRIKTLFLKEIKKSGPKKIRIIDRAIRLNGKSNWSSFIQSAFVWGNTGDGHDFWYEISKKFK
jgi:hypothetical protein